MKKILLIEDEVKIARWIVIYLEKAGYETAVAFNGLEGLEMADLVQPDLILLDLMLPRIRGEEVCARIRQKNVVPIIVLTAKNTKRDIVNCLDIGADDYITKPFDPDELVSRVNAVLRRSSGETVEVLRCGPMEYCKEKGSLKIDGEEIPMSTAQLMILEVFMKKPNVILSRAQLIESAFPSQFSGYERAIDNHIKRIRSLINSKDFNPIKTVYGGGYKLEC